MFRKLLVPCVILFAVLLLASLACGETTPTSTPKVSTATSTASESLPSDTPEQTTQPTETPKPQVYLGDVVEQDGYSLSATTLEDPVVATDYSTIYDGPPQDKKLVAIEIIVGNVSGKEFSSNPLNAILVDSEGFNYQAELASRASQLELIDIHPGNKVKGWIGFEIPANAIPAALKYEFAWRVALQVGLTSRE